MTVTPNASAGEPKDSPAGPSARPSGRRLWLVASDDRPTSTTHEARVAYWQARIEAADNPRRPLRLIVGGGAA